MFRCTCFLSTIVLLGIGRNVPAGTPFTENFLDDALLDGQPAYWHHVEPVETDVEDGTLSVYSIGNVGGALVAFPEDEIYDDVILQTQIRYVESRHPLDAVSLFGRASSDASSYWGGIGPDGSMLAGVSFDGVDHTLHTVQTGFEVYENDVMLELRLAESQIEVSAWQLGSERPAAPQISFSNDQLQSGFVGLTVDAAGDQLEALFRHFTATPITSTPTVGNLQAGDANQDGDFDQLDLVQVQVAAKYLTGMAATWGEGDWDGAPGGSPGSPPAGDGVFNQLDIIAAQQGAKYLAGPYAAVRAGGTIGDGQTSVIYNTGTGELSVNAPAGIELTSINIDSAAGIFTGAAAQNLGGSFDHDVDANIFKATFGGSFGSLSFGNAAQAGLSEEFVLNDLSVVGSLAGGGDLGNVDLVYVPEPASALLLAIGLVIGISRVRRKMCRS